MKQQDSNPDPSPLGGLSKRDFLRLAPLGFLIGMTGTASAAHNSSSPYPDGAWGVETIVGHGTSERPSIAELESAWSETYHFLFVDVDSGDRYYAEHGDIAWSQLGGTGGGGSVFGYDTVVSTSTDYTASPGELVLADPSGGAIEVTLPTHTTGDVVGVKKIDATSNAVDLVRGVDTDNVDLQRGIRLDAEDEFAGVISDGGSNWWSFEQVGSFETLIGAQVIDDFEDQDISEYTNDTGSFSVVDGSAMGDPTPIEGSWMLKSSELESSERIISTSGLDNYFEKGDNPLTVRWYLSSDNDDAVFLFGVEDLNNYYRVNTNNDSNAFSLFKNVGGNFTELANEIINPPNLEWLTITIHWETDNSITATLDDEAGTKLASINATDSDHANQTGVGWQSRQTQNGEIYFDDARIP